MKKQKAHGCQYTNLYLASIPSELKVIIGSNKEQVLTKVDLVSETAINSVFSQTVHVIPRYKIVDLRQSTDESTDSPVVAVPEPAASNENKMEETNENLSETRDNESVEDSNAETQTETNDGDTYQSLKRKRGGRKPSA